MADFENGLPPSDIGITGSEISNINYETKEFNNKTDNNDVYAISYQQKELFKEVNVGLNAISYQANKAEISSAIGIQAISFQVEKVEGNNTVLFYL